MTCLLCNEELSPSDDEGIHRECSLRSAIGGIGHVLAHNYWCLQCNDPDAGLTYRQSAIMVDHFVALLGVDEAVSHSYRHDTEPMP